MNYDLTQFAMGRQEHPTHIKFNNIIFVLEQMRRIHGPYSFEIVPSSSTFPITVSSIYLKLVDDPTTIGGIYSSGGNNRFYKVFRAQITATNDRYAHFTNLVFSFNSTANGYIVRLDSSNKSYLADTATFGTTASQIDLRTVSTGNLSIYSTLVTT